MPNTTQELTALASLFEKGLLTRSEFEQQKAQLLGRSTSTPPNFGTLPPSSSPQVGHSIGAFRITGELGRGGMGVVYQGRHRVDAMAERYGGDVAIKVMHAQYAQNPEFQRRFEREASLGIKLQHPGIVKVHELIVDGQNLALVMDLAEGRPLSEVIGQETGPIPWQRAWPMFKQLLQAVGCAHEQQVVHRDLKPENVILAADGTLKVLDFGIAKDLESGKTKTGTGMGTVDYMAPEQYTDAKSVDQRADIYALGMTLYEMLAGRLPWELKDSEFAVMTLKSKGDLPPPTKYYPEIPSEAVRVIQQATTTQPKDRIQTVAAFIAALENIQVEDERFEEWQPDTSTEPGRDTPFELAEAPPTETQEESAKEVHWWGAPAWFAAWFFGGTIIWGAYTGFQAPILWIFAVFLVLHLALKRAKRTPISTTLTPLQRAVAVFGFGAAITYILYQQTNGIAEALNYANF